MSTTHDSRELPVSESELACLTREMAEAHRETLPVMRASAAALAGEIATKEDPRGAVARRRFLLGAGGAGAGLLLAACSDGRRSGSPTALKSAGTAADASQYTGDLKIVALAVALENQAVGAYRTTLSAAKAGKLGTVPPAVSTFVTTAMAQHADHAKVWNAALKGAGKPTITGVPLSDQKSVTDMLGKATNVTDVAKLALQLENQAAQTYFFTTYNVTSGAAIDTAATIAPVEAMHAAILHFILGQYPVPDAFLPVSQAAKTSLLTV